MKPIYIIGALVIAGAIFLAMQGKANAAVRTSGLPSGTNTAASPLAGGSAKPPAEKARDWTVGPDASVTLAIKQYNDDQAAADLIQTAASAPHVPEAAPIVQQLLEDANAYYKPQYGGFVSTAILPPPPPPPPASTVYFPVSTQVAPPTTVERSARGAARF